ncbi:MULTISPECIES: ArsR/SmtB family transcription factor [Xanthomonas]|uniref:ArsR/SmtB family transcription factor n=1 Tax=Xanthomonas TaxID=338 RepID=UPI001ADBA2A7|nr:MULTISPECIES: helix-turn-helix transcriptional regulator [unclassified Xanthomonas]MBO9875089.1 helix-turn-helix transcriptional regulator [Xanthomonas sp. D-93]WNH45819.1 helix-turn-helix transcriptional regulator [Xanthomonas sp. A6251]
MHLEHPKLAATAFLIADPARAAMLMALLDGRALPAGELAFAGGVTPQTASAHLAKLLEGGLLTVEVQGRHRYYRLANAHVATVLETLATLAPPQTSRCRRPHRDAQPLRLARCCYDHLAGRLGVAVAEALEQRAWLTTHDDATHYAVSSDGAAWFARMGMDLPHLAQGRRAMARRCLDWTERRHHLAGSLGAALLDQFCARHWLRRADGSRALVITDLGWASLQAELGIRRLEDDALTLDR